MNPSPGIFLFLCLLVQTGWSLSPPLQDPSAPPVEALVEEALRKNPTLKAWRHRQAAAAAGVRRAGAYASPEVAVETGRRTQVDHQGEKSMPVNALMARQMLMFPGKVSAMRQAEKHRAAAYGWETATEADRLALEVRNLYYELYMHQRRRAINAENRGVMEKFESVARTQYEAGMGRMEDILRAQTELSRLRSEDVILAREYQGMEAMLNAVLDRPPETPLGHVRDPEDSPRALPGIGRLDSLAREFRPELKAMAEDVRMSQWEWKAAQREKYPDFMLEGRWMIMEGPDEWSVAAGVSVPLAPWSIGTYRGGRDAAEGRWMETRERENAMKNMVRAEIHRAVAELEAARERVGLALGSTIPLAEQTLRSTEAAYRAGKTEFLMLLDAYRMLFMAREESYMARAALERGWAGLERSVGLPRDKLFDMAGAGTPQGGSR